MKPHYLTPLCLALMLGAAPLLAQPEAEDAAGATAATGEAEKPSASAQQAPAPSEPAPNSSSNRSPFDYRSSEEISEDVPVSFPVDI